MHQTQNPTNIGATISNEPTQQNNLLSLVLLKHILLPNYLQQWGWERLRTVSSQKPIKEKLNAGQSESAFIENAASI